MNDQMVDKKTWKEFREIGLLWWANRILHLFGWAIVVVQEDDGTISDAYPARVKFRGFGEESETRGFKRLSGYLKDHATILEEEAQE
jgi:hypothetical protein